jgi:hypothetical protein
MKLPAPNGLDERSLFEEVMELLDGITCDMLRDGTISDVKRPDGSSSERGDDNNFCSIEGLHSNRLFLCPMLVLNCLRRLLFTSLFDFRMLDPLILALRLILLPLRSYFSWSWMDEEGVNNTLFMTTKNSVCLYIVME